MNIKDEILIRRKPTTGDFVLAARDQYNSMNKQKVNAALEPRAYLITVTYNDLKQETEEYLETNNVSKKNYYDPESVLKITYARQRDFIKHVINQTVPSNYYPSRKKNYPIFYSFIDLSGSRHSKTNFLKMPHTHSLCLVPPKTVQKFESLRMNRFKISHYRSKTKHIQTIHCVPVCFDRDSIYRVLDYSSKFYRYWCDKNMFSEDTRSLLFDM